MARDLALFATEVYPLHPSMLRQLLTCPWRVAMGYLDEPVDEHGQAGDTGSAMHVAVSEFHNGVALPQCLAAMQERRAEYPKADLVDAASLFLLYANDHRNYVEVVATEHPIEFSIDPAPEDKTGHRIQVIGTADQVREVDGQLYLWDLKTSKRDPMEVLNESTLQIAAYCIGMSVALGKQVNPGGIIAPRKYRSDSSGPAHWHFPWRFRDIPQLMLAVRHHVALIRNGVLWHNPNPDCRWCPMRSPDLCFPRLINHGQQQRPA